MEMLALAVVEKRADIEATSIREFCELPTPVFMFDKNGDFVVMKLEQVSCLKLPDLGCIEVVLTLFLKLLPLSFGPEALPPRGTLLIFFR